MSPAVATTIHRLAIKDVFDGLSAREKHYAHYLSKAAWAGSRVVMRQTSPESNGIFDFIMSMHRACGGRWDDLREKSGISADGLNEFLDYCGTFLCNLGNYLGEGDQKFAPRLSFHQLRRLAAVSAESSMTLESIIDGMADTPSARLAFPDGVNQSNYYPGNAAITPSELEQISSILTQHGVEPENTRVSKTKVNRKNLFVVQQASSEAVLCSTRLDAEGLPGLGLVQIVGGDHAKEMSSVCRALAQAKLYASNENQVRMISELIQSFQTGNLSAYRKAQQIWVTDISPSVDPILGFVETYRDPAGVRAEWEGVVCISDPGETSKLQRLIDDSTIFVRKLPWAVADINDGKGPFEASLFKAPDFTIVHALAFCSSIFWEAVNLPNYTDIKETHGSKNILFFNRMSANYNPSRPCHYIDPTDLKGFRGCNHVIRFIVTAIHELLGHGSGKLLSETSPGEYNFNKRDPPTSPLTQAPIRTWYLPGQTWTGVFGKLATSVEECRAMLMSYYLADDKDILAVFGYDDSTNLSADDLIYYTYLHVGVEGIQALQQYSVEDQAWTQPHARANFAILKHLLLDGDGVLTGKLNAQEKTVHVHVDRSKILSHGKPSLGRMLCKIHVWRCTADVKACTAFYDPLSSVDGEYELWRQIVASKPEPRWKFVQPNTFLNDLGEVGIRLYEESNEGIIQSFVDKRL